MRQSIESPEKTIDIVHFSLLRASVVRFCFFNFGDFGHLFLIRVYQR